MRINLPVNTGRLIKAPAMATVASIHHNHKIIKSATVRKYLPKSGEITTEKQPKVDQIDYKRKSVKVIFSQAIIAD